ncbi:MAG: hypothetical protein GX638_18280 [Crenarchaeota archaeon]|nr:hypothetical protein [Thermoproteota archaeon]
MLEVILFRLIQLVVMGIFIVFISDFRKKKNMTPLIGEKWTFLLKLSYLVPLVTYIFVLFIVDSITTLDLVALIITAAGTSIIIKAKRDLSLHHTWVGYCISSTNFTTNGIYAYIRHPIYTGIYIFIVGSLFTILPHLNIASHITLSITAILSITYIMSFLAFLANKETKKLLLKHGVKFEQYKNKVHPFLPIKNIKNLDEKEKSLG